MHTRCLLLLKSVTLSTRPHKVIHSTVHTHSRDPFPNLPITEYKRVQTIPAPLTKKHLLTVSPPATCRLLSEQICTDRFLGKNSRTGLPPRQARPDCRHSRARGALLSTAPIPEPPSPSPHYPVCTRRPSSQARHPESRDAPVVAPGCKKSRRGALGRISTHERPTATRVMPTTWSGNLVQKSGPARPSTCRHPSIQKRPPPRWRRTFGKRKRHSLPWTPTRDR
jgi:hypothetical protein